jgi:hypothetical protein
MLLADGLCLPWAVVVAAVVVVVVVVVVSLQSFAGICLPTSSQHCTVAARRKSALRCLPATSSYVRDTLLNALQSGLSGVDDH